jgi:hypothetical protein
MVGFEGDRPTRLVRVIAKNPVYPNLKREVDVPQREDGLAWKPGHEIGLHGSSWREKGDATVHAIITEIVND